MDAPTSPDTMTGDEIEVPWLDPRDVEIYCWRVEQLERSGYSEAVAHALAVDSDVDLHLACELMTNGCPEETAFAILS